MNSSPQGHKESGITKPAERYQLLVKPEQNQPADGVNPQPQATLNQTSPPTDSGVSATGTPNYIIAPLISLQSVKLWGQDKKP